LSFAVVVVVVVSGRETDRQTDRQTDRDRLQVESSLYVSLGIDGTSVGAERLDD